MRKRYLFYSLALASVLGANAKTPSIPTHDGETIEETDSVKRAKTHSPKTRTAVNCVRKGVVVDAETGEPIIGASVFVKSTHQGTVTNERGEYSCQCPKGNDQIVISFVGKKSREVTAGDNLKILLYDDETQLKDVVVVAYGSAKRANLTSSIGSLHGSDILTNPVTSLEQAMSGKLSGVNVTTATGSPGGAVIVNIRGISSITAGNDPLYVVDGVPVVSTDITRKGGFQGNSVSGIADINPNDIESIEVLKDASAAALYGSRASNGVILVTTKRGRTMRPRVTLDSYIGYQDIAHNLEFLNASEYVAARNEAIDNYNTSLGLSAGDGAYLQHISPVVAGADTNWFDEITRSKALQTSHQLSVSGLTNRGNYFFSAGYYNQEGIVEKTDYHRYNIRSNVEYQINKRVRITSNIALSSAFDRRSTGDNNIYSPWICAFETTPDQPIYNENGSYFTTNENNPVHLCNEQEQWYKRYRAIVSLKADVDITNDLKYHLNLGGDYNIQQDFGYFPETSLEGATTKGESSDYRNFVFTNLIEHTLTYGHAFGKLNLDALLGYSYQKRNVDYNGVTGVNFISPTLKYIESASEVNSGTSSLSENALQSFFGRVNLNYDDRYLLDLSLRADQSSKFAPSKRTGYFPAASLGWRVSNESFFPKHAAVNGLKIRASIGLTGNQEGISNYNYFTVYSASGIAYSGNPGLGFSYYMPTPDLTWEKTLQTGVGVDLSLFNSRLDITFDWYRKDTRDLLLTHSVNSLSGYSSQTSNAGRLLNNGVELGIRSQNFNGAFGWTTSFVLTYSRSKVKELYKDVSGNSLGYDTGYVNRIEAGEDMSAFYLVKALGIYQTKEEILAESHGEELWNKGIRPGDVKYYDKNDDGVINDDDREFCGTPFPKFFGSLNNNFTWKGFDLAIGLNYSLGAKIYAYWKAGQTGVGNLGGQQTQILREEWENRWTASNPSTSVPRAVASGSAFTNNTLESTRYLESADFLKIRSLTLGYTLPENLTSKVGIERLRFYLQASNLYTFTGYDGFDPEVAVFPSYATYRGTDVGSVPQLRSFIFGLNLNF